MKLSIQGMVATTSETDGGQREAILDAAFGCFARYGFRRTSLGDIAEAAGLSRPALYHYFRNKEDVFRALSQRINRGVLAAVTAAAGQPGDTRERLTAVLEAKAGWAFDLLHASEHGRELIDAKNRLCGGSGAEAEAEFAALVERILARGEAKGDIALGPTAMSPAEAAAFLIDSVGGVIGKETVEAEARRRLRILTRLFVGGLAPR